LLKRLKYFVTTGKGKNIDMDKIFDPEKYGMVFCPDCEGKGKLPKKPDGFIVCSTCGGCGAIRKEKEAREEGRK
jgi:DnaJ-class molecular chaperone